MLKNNFATVSCLILALANFGCTAAPGLSALQTGTSSSKASDLSDTLASGNGNGQHYGGKLTPGVYVRPLTENLCGPAIKNLGVITIKENSASGKVVDLNTCTYVDLAINPDKFVHTEYLKGPIAYVEGLYVSEKSLLPPVRTDSSGTGSIKDPTSPNIDEVWCRRDGSTSKAGFDVVINANYQTKKYTATVVSSVLSADGKSLVEKRAPFSVSRRFEDNDRVRYSASGFELDIRRRDFNREDGTMTADFDYNINGASKELELRCRLGGQLDVMIPAL